MRTRRAFTLNDSIGLDERVGIPACIDSGSTHLAVSMIS